MYLELSAHGDEVAERRLAHMGRVDAHALMSDLADELLAGQRRHWAAPGWVPLAASTRARKLREGLPPQANRASGRLEAAMTVRGAPGQRLTITAHEVILGLDSHGAAYYGKFAQKGIGEPKRVILPKPTEMTRVALRMVVRRRLNP
jgi:hypothetical protein